MKKILCLTLCAFMVLSFVACGKKTDDNPASDVKNEATSTPEATPTETPISKEVSSLLGQWTIEKAEYASPSDPMVVAMVSLLKDRFAQGMNIEFKEDGKATVGEEEAEFSFADDLLTLTWENNKNFVFKKSGNGNKLDLIIENVLNATIVKK